MYSLWKLRLTMAGTLALVMGASTLFVSVLLSVMGVFSILSMVAMVALFSVGQWLVAPYMIRAMYHVKEVPYEQSPKLHAMVEEVASSARVPKPKVMYSPIAAPNAFAYGSPLGGNRVCMTQGLLDNLNDGEIKAVLGHELGHLKHRDVQLMMFVSVIPAIFYWIGYSFFWSGMFSGGRGRNGGSTLAIGALAMLAYFVLNLLVLGLSRQRELYADRHGAQVVENGAAQLSTALTKLDAYGRGKRGTPPPAKGFRSMMIVDPGPGRDARTALAEGMSPRGLTLGERIRELFSTHPHTARRISALMYEK